MRVLLGPWLLLALGACAEEPAREPCTADRACGSGVCAVAREASPRDLEPQPLQCAELRDGAAPGAACTTGDSCDRGLCLLAGACARACDSSADCDASQRCQAIYTRSSVGLTQVSACIDQVNLPSDATVRRTLLTVRAAEGGDTVTLPAEAPRTLYVLEHQDDHSWPIPPSTTTCRPPLCAQRLSTEDTVLFDATQLDDPDGPKVGVAQGQHVDPLTVWVPNGPRVAAEARSYELLVESKVAGAVQLHALSRAERGTQLDLNLYYVGAAGLSPQGERGVPQLAAALDEVDRIFAPAGVQLGEIRQIEIPGALPERGSGLMGAEASAGFRVLASQYQVLPELPELFRLSAGAANPALDVFLVADIEAHGGDLGGIAGGTPVPFGMHGSAGSGIAIAADMFMQADDPVALGRTLAHELGHALGLFHTTELDGRVTDPLPDTPTCPLEQDSDRSGTLDARECAAHGGNNLMFPTSDAGADLTPDQRAVLQSALILR